MAANVTRDIIVVGASAGGVQALQQLVSKLPSSLPASLFVVLHIWPASQSHLADILSRAGPLPAEHATNEAPIRRGRVYVAPSDFHLLIEEGRMLVLRGPKENRFRPAINPLFRSAAAAYRNRVIGVILTGLLDDGAAGLWAIKQCGGVTIVQSDAQFDQMPQAALENVEVDHHVPLADIPALLDRLTRESIPTNGIPPVPEVVRLNNEGVKMKTNGFAVEGVGRRSLFSCPECNGALWEMDEGKHLHFRCHVGHAYAAGVLAAAQNSNIEQSLWTALRALKESAALDQRLADRSNHHGLRAAAEAHKNNADQKLAQADEIQTFLLQLRPADVTPAK
jgi:two-component system chemotaxis response regulator CheB